MNLLIGLLLAGLVLASVSLQLTYAHLPAKELKRRARQDDKTAALVHQAAVYGTSLRAVLWALIALSSAGFCLYAAGHWPAWLAVLSSTGLVLAAFVWLPNLGVKKAGLWLAASAAPVFAWLLQYIHSPLAWTHQHIQKYVPGHVHTGVFDKEDLLEIINSQNGQPDNLISETELELAFNALTFGDKLISDYLTPRRAVKAVAVGDSIGPILMAELHKSGFVRFPVYDGKKDNIVGTLFLRDLVNTKSTASVRDVMRPSVYYVHEDHNLHDALQAILKTHHHLLIVVNSHQDYVGVISIEEILEQVVGKSILDEFEQYDDKSAVATRARQKTEPEASEAATEVIE